MAKIHIELNTTKINKLDKEVLFNLAKALGYDNTSNDNSDEVVELNNEINYLKEELSDKNDKLKNTLNKLENREIELADGYDKIEKLEKDLKVVGLREQSLIKDIESLENENKELLNTNSVLDKKVENLQEELKVLKEDNSKLNEYIKNLENNVDNTPKTEPIIMENNLDNTPIKQDDNIDNTSSTKSYYKSFKEIYDEYKNEVKKATGVGRVTNKRLADYLIKKESLPIGINESTKDKEKGVIREMNILIDNPYKYIVTPPKYIGEFDNPYDLNNIKLESDKSFKTDVPLEIGDEIVEFSDNLKDVEIDRSKKVVIAPNASINKGNKNNTTEYETEIVDDENSSKYDIKPNADYSDNEILTIDGIKEIVDKYPTLKEWILNKYREEYNKLLAYQMNDEQAIYNITLMIENKEYEKAGYSINPTVDIIDEDIPYDDFDEDTLTDDEIIDNFLNNHKDIKVFDRNMIGMITLSIFTTYLYKGIRPLTVDFIKDNNLEDIKNINTTNLLAKYIKTIEDSEILDK